MNDPVTQLTNFIEQYDGKTDKDRLCELVVTRFGLANHSKVFYCHDFAIRFSSSARRSFPNTVTSLANIKKFDDRPFIACLVTPARNYCFLANATFVKKISHSSEKLRENKIVGSFDGSNIIREFEGIRNCPKNFDRLFNIHVDVKFEDNLTRIVEATKSISPTGEKFNVGERKRTAILGAPQRAAAFIASQYLGQLKGELDARVANFRNEILLAALIENVNVRGRVIEYLIAGEDESLRQEMICSLKERSKNMPEFKTENSLGDYQRVFDEFYTETDIKTKILTLSSSPTAYNLDKTLKFLATDHSVFMFYFVGIKPSRVDTALVSIFQRDLLRSTRQQRHWAGKNSRGATQFEGRVVEQLIANSDSNNIDLIELEAFLEEIIALQRDPDRLTHYLTENPF